MWQVPPGDGPGESRRPALGCVSRIYAVASGRVKGAGEAGGGPQGGGGAHGGAMGDDDPGAPGENAPAFSLGWGCAARRPSGGRAAGWRSAGYALGQDDPYDLVMAALAALTDAAARQVLPTHMQLAPARRGRR